jgi:hypothetical protein
MHATVDVSPDVRIEAKNWVLAYVSFGNDFGKLTAFMSNANVAKSDVAFDAWQEFEQE